jgi:hypothetical protein
MMGHTCRVICVRLYTVGAAPRDSSARRAARLPGPGNRRFWSLSALRAHTDAPYKTDIRWGTRRALHPPRAGPDGSRGAGTPARTPGPWPRGRRAGKIHRVDPDFGSTLTVSNRDSHSGPWPRGLCGPHGHSPAGRSACYGPNENERPAGEWLPQRPLATSQRMTQGPAHSVNCRPTPTIPRKQSAGWPMT